MHSKHMDKEKGKHDIHENIASQKHQPIWEQLNLECHQYWSKRHQHVPETEGKRT